MSVLSDILRRTKSDLIERKARVPLSELQRKTKDVPPTRSLKKALRAARFSIIGEIKEKSPSAGAMSPESVLRAASVYAHNRAISAVSVLTDGPFFGGSLDRLWQMRKRIPKPILRKDFIVDEYQVWEARAHGADAILLMASVHADRPTRLRDLFTLARELGMQCLMEIGMSHVPPAELADMIPPEADIWGINSRNFDSTRFEIKHQVGKVFSSVRSIGPDVSVNSTRHADLRRLIPAGKLAVAESGISKPSALRALIELEYNACLIGTAFLRPSGAIADIVKDFATELRSIDQQPVMANG